MFWKRDKIIEIDGLCLKESMLDEKIVQEAIQKKRSEITEKIDKIGQRKPRTLEAISNSLESLQKLNKDLEELDKIYNPVRTWADY